MLLSDLWKLTWSFWQIENNKSALLPSVSRGYRVDRGPLAVVRLASQLVQNLSLVMSLGGIRGVWLQHLNLPAAPSLHPKYLTDSQGTAGDSGNGGPHSRLCSPQFVNKWIEHMALHFLSFLFLYQGFMKAKNFRFLSKLLAWEAAESGKREMRMCLFCYFFCFFFVFDTSLFVLRRSFGMHSIKAIINTLIGSFIGPDLQGHLQSRSLFFSCSD